LSVKAFVVPPRGAGPPRRRRRGAEKRSRSAEPAARECRRPADAAGWAGWCSR